MQNSRRVAESRPVCMDLKVSNSELKINDAARGQSYKEVIKVNYDQWKSQPTNATYLILNHYLTTK